MNRMSWFDEHEIPFSMSEQKQSDQNAVLKLTKMVFDFMQYPWKQG